MNIPEENQKVNKRWGLYTISNSCSDYHVKRIELHSGGQLSLQSHDYRNKYWVVVSGLAKAIKEQEIIYLSPNDSLFIPRGSKHRLRNIGNVHLVLMDVQWGEYLSETDIIRYEDICGREDKN